MRAVRAFWRTSSARPAVGADPRQPAGAGGPDRRVRSPTARFAAPDGHPDQRVRRLRAGAADAMTLGMKMGCSRTSREREVLFFAGRLSEPAAPGLSDNGDHNNVRAFRS